MRSEVQQVTVVLVHGIPETPEIWEPLQAELGIPTIAVALPGLAGPTEAGWAGGKDDLATWLDGELGRLEPPIDVVGHDLGALLVLRLVTAGSTDIRSWVVDVPDLFAPDARFSPSVQRLQQDDDWAEQLARVTRRSADDDLGWAGRLRAAGVSDGLARRIAGRHDDRTDAAIGAFYRSATPDVAADWWPQDSSTARSAGLALLLPDPPDVEQRSRYVADRLGARTAPLDSGHCWMAADPRAAAGVITGFWADALRP